MDFSRKKILEVLAGEGLRTVEFVRPVISSPFFVDPDPALVKGLEHNGYPVIDIDEYPVRYQRPKMALRLRSTAAISVSPSRVRGPSPMRVRSRARGWSTMT